MPKREPDMTHVRILRADRLIMSRSGNPRFRITFYDQDGSWTYKTKSDASVNYEVENYRNSKEWVDVWLTKSDTVEYIEPARQGTH